MRELDDIGICPHCDCSLTMFKTNQHKRFVKCEICGHSYALPKAGKISNSAMICPKTKHPVLIIEKAKQKAYFWADIPCFSCSNVDKCEIIKELEDEFIELEVYGYKKADKSKT